jgi:hypothetical protein
VIGGLAVATVLTLLFLPAMYVMWFRVKEPRPSERNGGAGAPEPSAAAATVGV